MTGVACSFKLQSWPRSRAHVQRRRSLFTIASSWLKQGPGVMQHATCKDVTHVRLRIPPHEQDVVSSVPDA